MRNYDSLDITYCTKDRKVIEGAMPPRAKVSGGASGPGFEYTKSTGYSFNPPLTKEEITGLVEKLIDLGVKLFTFQDTRSLSQDN